MAYKSKMKKSKSEEENKEIQE